MMRSSKSRLTPKQLDHFPGDTLFAKIARAVCMAGVLPAKELFEAWEVARRVRRQYRGGRVVDVASGHGLLPHIMLLLDDTSPEALAVDTVFPENAVRISRSMVTAWPRLKGRIRYVEAPVQTISVVPGDLVAAVHACGMLTDTVLEKAVCARARVAVLPCCHDIARSDTGGLEGWVDGTLAVDIMRVVHLRSMGYTVSMRTIPADITPKNRLLLGHPNE